jgi:murein DD-endopeptidase MepM/ murein hydrolase activator NlpD
MISRLELLWVWLRRAFPERQVYIRSGGKVRFFSLGASLQAIFAGLALIGFGWTAFSTVNVVFKDRIVAAREHRFQQMQAVYENRVAELQISYDGLNAAVAQAQSRADGALAAFHRRQVLLVRAGGASAAPPPGITRATRGRIATSADARPPHEMPMAVANLLRGVFDPLGNPKPHRPHALPPALAGLEADTTAIAQLGGEADFLMAYAQGDTLRRMDDERNLIAQTGIEPGQFLRKFAAAEGVGGPELPLEGIKLNGISDPEFTQTYLQAEANLAQLPELAEAINHLPLSIPVRSINSRTSGFGPRIDPFTGRYAFHSGVDFAGPVGSAVTATNAGRVVSAGYDGSYGNMVEIDHGMGLRTRYAHLMAVTVRAGQIVTKGMVVGRLGSTGRSTGPHVHYEVWYDNTVRNPDGFIRAGQTRPSLRGLIK